MAVEIYARTNGDRNRAVLKIDEVDQKIRATKGNERLEAEFDKMKLPYLDRVSTCEEITAQSMDKVDLLEAKLGLLR